VLVIIGFFACSPPGAHADDAQPAEARGALFHPDGPGELRLRVGAGLLLDILPRSLVEAELRHALRVAATARLGLPYQFGVELSVDGIVFYNEALLGVSWSVALGEDVSIRVVERFGVWVGLVPLAGLLHVPGIAVGLRHGPHRFTLHADLYLTSAHHVAFGDAEVVVQVVRLAGAAFGVKVESPGVGDGSVYYGVELFYTTPDYQLWLAFSDTQTRSLYPRFVFGYVF
jgi:hypothetical protein